MSEIVWEKETKARHLHNVTINHEKHFIMNNKKNLQNILSVL